MSAISDYVRTRNQGGIDVPTTVDLLRRYALLERSCLRALAGWFLRAPAYETKIALGYHLWSHAERADALRRRLRELRGGHRDANAEPALQAVADELVNAPDDAAFLAGMRRLLSHLADAYREHRALADPSANAMEVRILDRLLPDLEGELAWYAQQAEPHAWSGYLDSLLGAAGGVSGLEPRSAAPPRPPHRFERPTRIAFDERITDGTIPSHDRRNQLAFDEHRVSEFQVFFNEFYAAALLASIIYDAWTSDAPWEFFFDMSHHFWDEVRHSEFGLRRLRELGVEPALVNQVLFEKSQGLPFLHRLCYLTLGLEVYFMPRKAPRVRKYQAVGDHRSQLFADVDWSDEGNHVRYGKRWVDHFLNDDARTAEDLHRETMEQLQRAGLVLPEGQLAPF